MRIIGGECIYIFYSRAEKKANLHRVVNLPYATKFKSHHGNIADL